MKIRFDKPVVAEYHFNQYEVYVVEDDEDYNVHIIDPKYKQDENNTLRLQEPKVCMHPDNFTKSYLICILSEHILWDIFYDQEGPLSFIVKVDGDNV